MKRIIKFRAYTEISNEVLGMKYDVPHNYNDTVMQFTGLLDRHGKEIYEGDIVKLKNNVCYVEWRDCGFSLRQDGPNGKPWEYNGNLKGYCDGLWGGPPEIIGNILENPLSPSNGDFCESP